MILAILTTLALITGQNVYADESTDDSASSIKISDCNCNCESMSFYDEASNLHQDKIRQDDAGNDLTDASSCKTFCETKYPNQAIYYAWVDQSFRDPEFRDTCWCKTETDADGTEEAGVTSGKIYCKGRSCVV